MSKINRRDFLMLIGAGGIGAGAGFLFGEANKNPVEQLIPYLIPPEDQIPGVSTWYNTVCRQCAAGCGIMVRIREGRAKKIEGNPLHPVNQGRLCAMGQAGLQVLYNPDRIRTPLKRSGERGSGAFTEVSWDEAISTLSDKLKELSDSGEGDKIHLLTEPVRGHQDIFFDKFMDALGSEKYSHFDFTYPRNLYEANKIFFGEDTLPYYDIKNTNFLLSFGTDFMGGWISPVHHGISYGHMRQGRDTRGRLVQIEPRLSLTGASADEWIQTKPGTEGLLALGLSHILVSDGVYKGNDRDLWVDALADYHPQLISRVTGVSEEKVRTLAREFSHAKPGLAVGGSAVANYTNGVLNLLAINALNYLSGNIGKPGGILFNPKPAVGKANMTNHTDILQLTSDLSGAGALIVYNTNPVFSAPDSADVENTLQKVPFIASLSCFMDETTEMADLILPTHSYLESWGDDTPEPGVGIPVASLSQPVVKPLYDTKAVGDICLSVAKHMGGDIQNKMSWNSYEDYLKDAWQGIYEERKNRIEEGTFKDFWNAVLKAGVWGEKRSGFNDSRKVGNRVISEVTFEAPFFEGDEKEFPLYLHPYQTQTFNDGRGANLPWMQELPDPMTSIVYASWVELNPKTAKELKVRDGDIVLVESPSGKVESRVHVYPAIMPDVVAMPVGQGHTAYGRYAKGRGSNPLHILSPAKDNKSGAFAWAATRVKITRTGERVMFAKTAGNDRMLGRDIYKTTGHNGKEEKGGGHH
jgi:anaerobic selenocysteine-containing dehydrogenase